MKNALAVLLTLAAFSCGKPQTVGEVCDDVGDALCARALQCGADTTENSCFAAFKGGCCTESGTCDVLAENHYSADYVDRCTAGAKAIACEELLGGNIPKECLQKK